MNTIRVLVVDDHTLFRDGPSAILQNVPDVAMVGEAVAQAAILAPDVILMDISIQICSALNHVFPNTRGAAN